MYYWYNFGMLHFGRKLVPLLLCVTVAMVPLLPGRCACSDSIVCSCKLKSSESQCCCCHADTGCCTGDSTNECSESCACSHGQSLQAVPVKKLPLVFGFEAEFVSTWERIDHRKVTLQNTSVNTFVSHNTRLSLLGVWLK